MLTRVPSELSPIPTLILCYLVVKRVKFFTCLGVSFEYMPQRPTPD